MEWLTLKWGGFLQNRREALRELRQKDKFYDVTLISADGKQVPAHQEILAGSSSFFYTILKENCHPDPSIYLTGVKYKHLVNLLDYIYTGEASMAQEEFNDFFDILEDFDNHKGKSSIFTPAPLQSQATCGRLYPSPQELDGEEFKDKESFVTSAFRKKMEEMPKEEAEKEKRQDAIEVALDVRKHGDMRGFNRHIYCQTMSEEKGQVLDNIKQEIVKQEPVDSDKDEKIEDFIAKKTNDKKRECRKREEDDDKDEEGEESRSNVFYSRAFGAAAEPSTAPSPFPPQQQSQSSSPVGGQQPSSAEDQQPHLRTADGQLLQASLLKQGKIIMRNGQKVLVVPPAVLEQSLQESQLAAQEHASAPGLSAQQGLVPTHKRALAPSISTQYEANVLTQKHGSAPRINAPNEPKVSPEERASENKLSKEYASSNSDIVTSKQSHKLKTQSCDKTYQYQCEVCHKKCTSLSKLKVHQRIHSGEKPYECDVCNKKFSQHVNLTMHTRVHTGEKPYQCLVCSKSFSALKNLKSHNYTHTSEKPFKCLACPKSFTVFKNLKEHNYTHTGEKPFKCLSCPKEFSRSFSLNVHKKIHTGEKSYQCPLCSKSFTESGTLKKHMKRKKKCSM